MVPLEEFKYGGTNVTAFRILDPEREEVRLGQIHISYKERERDSDRRTGIRHTGLDDIMSKTSSGYELPYVTSFHALGEDIEII